MELPAQLMYTLVLSAVENVGFPTLCFLPRDRQRQIGYCGNTTAPAANGVIIDLSPADCSMPCPRNTAEICRGENEMNIYKNLKQEVELYYEHEESKPV